MFISICTNYYLTPVVISGKRGLADQHQTDSSPNRRDKMHLRHAFVRTFPAKELFTAKAQKLPVFHEGLKDPDYSKLLFSEKFFSDLLFSTPIPAAIYEQKTKSLTEQY